MAAPVPMPYVPVVLIKPETVSGVRSYKANLVLDLVFSGFALTIALVALFYSTSTSIAAIGFSAILGAAACGLIIVFIINFIMSLMSVMKMHHGAKEYGPEHEAHARRGVLFKWLGTALSTAAAVLVVYLVLFGVGAIFTGSQQPTTLYIPLLITIFWTAGVTAKGQMYRSMVRALQPLDLSRISLVASLVIPSLGCLGIVAVGVATIRLQDAIVNPTLLSPVESAQLVQVLFGGIFLPPGLALVGYAMFLHVYTKTSDRLAQGLAQVHGAMVPIPWPGYGFPAPAVQPAPAVPGPTQTKACPTCGQSILASAAFCGNCGSRQTA